MKTLRRALAIIALVLLIVWLTAQLVNLAKMSRLSASAPAPAQAPTTGGKAPDELPREYVLKFHDAMWRRICIYLESDRSSDELEQKAHQVLQTSVRKAKESILTEAARRYPGSERVRERWREQLDQEEEAVWEKADISGEGHRPDKR